MDKVTDWAEQRFPIDCFEDAKQTLQLLKPTKINSRAMLITVFVSEKFQNLDIPKKIAKVSNTLCVPECSVLNRNFPSAIFQGEKWEI